MKVKLGMIGTERGNLLESLRSDDLRVYESIIPIQFASPRKKAVLLRYLSDMDRVIAQFARALRPSGTCVVICGDNCIDGQYICTYDLLSFLMTRNGFRLHERYGDVILRRMIPPDRVGHKSLIKEEKISVYSK